MDNQSVFQERLNRAFNRLNITKSELGRRGRIRRLMETEGTRPEDWELIALARELNVTLDYLLDPDVDTLTPPVELSDDAIRFGQVYDEDENFKLLSKQARNLNDEDFKLLLRFSRMLMNDQFRGVGAYGTNG
jgi:transcriptional regulator with XRE-family HTH domain